MAVSTNIAGVLQSVHPADAAQSRQKSLDRSGAKAVWTACSGIRGGYARQVKNLRGAKTSRPAAVILTRIPGHRNGLPHQ